MADTRHSLARAGAALLLLAASAWGLPGRRGYADRVFTEYPFDKWVEEGDHSSIKWKMRIVPAVLSHHQRLLSRVEVQIDGADVVKRRGRGNLLILVEVLDDQGAAYQNHGTIDLGKVEEGLKASNLVYSQSVFVLPGDYRVSAAIVDTTTGDHGARRDKTHVAPLRGDPLPDAWRDLPPVEILQPDEPPEAWYQPALRGRLHLPAAPPRPLKVQVLLNLAATTRERGALRTGDRNLGALIPALKALAQIESPALSIDVALLDLPRQSVVFRQDNVRELDWPKLKDSLAEAQPGKIDVRALEHRREQAAFFVKEVGRRVEASPSQVLIVLSNPVVFETGQDLQSVGLPAAPGCRVFYLRFHHDGMRLPPPDESMERRRRPGLIVPGGPLLNDAADDLAPTLKSLTPRLYEVRTPDQARRALAAILADLAAR